jgi:hypothetical protein
MIVRAMSDDDAEDLISRSFREGRTQKVRPSCVSARFDPTQQEICDA